MEERADVSMNGFVPFLLQYSLCFCWFTAHSSIHFEQEIQQQTVLCVWILYYLLQTRRATRETRFTVLRHQKEI